MRPMRLPGRLMRRHVYGRRSLAPVFELLRARALAGLYHGGDTFAETGELGVLDGLAAAVAGRHALVVDAGASTGAYAAEVLRRLPDVDLHCFEPSAAARALFAGRIDDGRVELHPYALGSAAKQAVLYAEAPASPLASLARRDASAAEEPVEVVRLDDFCDRRGVGRIDFLKVDAEGHDLDVIAGAGRMLDRIELIQFEFGEANLDSRTFLRDFFALLAPRFDLSRVCRDGVVPLGAYEPRYEVFVGANYLARRR